MAKKDKNKKKPKSIIPPPEENKKVSLQNSIDYPLFCFKYLDSSISIENANDEGFSFVKRANKLCELGWKEINKSDKHSFGSEYIEKSKLNITKFPKIVTDEVNKLIVFRYTGNNLPFVGLRNGNIIHVLFIESKFGDVYDHGSK